VKFADSAGSERRRRHDYTGTLSGNSLIGTETVDCGAYGKGAATWQGTRE
jgi:hypothetical protein